MPYFRKLSFQYFEFYENKASEHPDECLRMREEGSATVLLMNTDDDTALTEMITQM
jgi:hypothetical protein